MTLVGGRAAICCNGGLLHQRLLRQGRPVLRRRGARRCRDGTGQSTTGWPEKLDPSDWLTGPSRDGVRERIGRSKALQPKDLPSRAQVNANLDARAPARFRSQLTEFIDLCAHPDPCIFGSRTARMPYDASIGTDRVEFRVPPVQHGRHGSWAQCHVF